MRPWLSSFRGGSFRSGNGGQELNWALSRHFQRARHARYPRGGPADAVRAAMDASARERGGLFRPGEGGSRALRISPTCPPWNCAPGHAPLPDQLAEAARRSRRPLLRHERHGLGAAPGRERRPSLAVVDEQRLYAAARALETVPAEELLRGGCLLAAELRAILRAWKPSGSGNSPAA